MAKKSWLITLLLTNVFKVMKACNMLTAIHPEDHEDAWIWARNIVFKRLSMLRCMASESMKMVFFCKLTSKLWYLLFACDVF